MRAWRPLLPLLVLAACRASAVTEEALYRHGHRHHEHHAMSPSPMKGDVAAPDAPAVQHKQRQVAAKALAAAIKENLESEGETETAVARKVVDPDAQALREMRADALATAGKRQVDAPTAKELPAVDKVNLPAYAPVRLAKEEPEKDATVEKAVKTKKSDDVKKAVKATPAEVEEDEGDVEQPELPFSELQPFGRRNVGESLTESSISQSNAMVDQLERAEVAEEKRAVFRSLTRLRGVALSSFDGIARSQTGNIEEYAKHNHWRKKHPVKHLADEESDVKAWAFPANADF
eukprot:TRINITY_DN88075_c0_g1_i1.p1 TRINITY_DN88075_c0_g1~~TRINITY_DN88075_c0_g1_i1.p1  ORF type:complete len:291 (+),score=67.29 TRINITY_DN88075_c0_g1_i1:98-970(+)